MTNLIKDLLANVLRSVNARMIATDNRVYRKILKISFILSGKILRSGQPKRTPGPDYLIIENFDRDIRMKINRSGYIGAAIYWTGFHESREFFFLHRFLKAEMVFVDVGANQGEYTLFAAKRLVHGSVFAFEPLPSMRELLETNVKLNGFHNVNVLSCGLSNKPGRLAIHEVDDQNEGLATFFPGANVTKRTFEVELNTLDAIVAQRQLSRIDFIKMDIEGSELRALTGAEAAIHKFRPLIMVEINKVTFNAAGYDIPDVIRFFERQQYTPHTIDKNGYLRPCPTFPTMANIIFTPQ